jgi:hypothetical protein
MGHPNHTADMQGIYQEARRQMKKEKRDDIICRAAVIFFSVAFGLVTSLASSGQGSTLLYSIVLGQITGAIYYLLLPGFLCK